MMSKRCFPVVNMIARSSVLLTLIPALLLAACCYGANPVAFDRVGGGKLQVPAPKAKATVLIFVSSTCPIANGYAPEINRLTKKYQPKGVVISLVHTETGLTADEARKHLKDFGYQCSVLFDRQRKLVKQTGVTITPEAAVLSPAGKLLYRGRIDDRFPRIGIQREKPTRTELRDALDAIVAGKPVPVPRTKPAGCFIE